MDDEFMWVISATVNHTKDGWTKMVQIPTFYLDPNIQGTRTTKGAESVAKRIIDPLNVMDSVSIHAYQIPIVR